MLYLDVVGLWHEYRDRHLSRCAVRVYLGSAIGGLAGGPRGSDLGTVVGMVGGAAVGAAVGNAVDKAERQEVHDHYERVQAQRQRQCGAEAAHDGCSLDGEGRIGQPVAQLSADSLGRYSDDWSGFDASNSGDDRLYDFQGSDYSGNYSAAQPETVMPLESSVVSDVSAYTLHPILRSAMRGLWMTTRMAFFRVARRARLSSR